MSTRLQARKLLLPLLAILAGVLLLSGCSSWLEDGQAVEVTQPEAETGSAKPETQVEPVFRPFSLKITPDPPGVGEAFVLVVDPGTYGPLLSATAVFGEGDRVKNLTLTASGGRWFALIPISYLWPAGDYPLRITANSAVGEVSYEISVGVERRTYPEQHLQVSESTAALNTAERQAADWAKTSAARATSHATPLWDHPFIMPLEGPLTSEFGLIRYTNGVLSGRHSGLDIAGPEGAPVVAANNGIVVLAEELYVTGNTIIIDHGAWLFSSYCHLSKLEVAVGDHVEQGQVIGLVGSTGFSTGPHLHWSVNVGTTATSPWPLLGDESGVAPLLGELARNTRPSPRRP